MKTNFQKTCERIIKETELKSTNLNEIDNNKLNNTLVEWIASECDSLSNIDEAFDNLNEPNLLEVANYVRLNNKTHS